MNFLPLILVTFLSLFLMMDRALACACGCGIFNVATSSLIPNSVGGTAFLQYDLMNQKHNWSKHKKSAGHNHDKRIETQTTTMGLQYMFNRDFGASISVPYVTRYVKNLPHSGEMSYVKHSDIGDIRLKGIYSGFFEDMSTGITFGLKLPSGSSNSHNFERNTQIGSGTTDIIIGAYHMGNFGKNSAFGYFGQINFEEPMASDQGYKPGSELAAAIGSYYNLGQIGFAKRVAPILQISGTRKTQDTGYEDPSHNKNSGYANMYFTPGIEVTVKDFKFYADVEFPFYRSVSGNQLVADNIYKAVVSYNF